jgi:hypothetical protein
MGAVLGMKDTRPVLAAPRLAKIRMSSAISGQVCDDGFVEKVSLV